MIDGEKTNEVLLMIMFILLKGKQWVTQFSHPIPNS